MNKNYCVSDDIDSGKLTALFAGVEEYTCIYEDDAADLIQLAAIDEVSGEYIGFITCTIPDYENNQPDDDAMMNAYVAPDYRQKGVFSAMYDAVKDILRKDYGFDDEMPMIICPMEDDIYNALKSCHFAPSLHSREFLYGITGNTSLIHFLSKSDDYTIEADDVSDTCTCYQAVDDDDYIIGELYIDSFETQGCMNDVWVAPECRKKGIATQLVNYALNDYYSIDDNAGKSIILHVTGSNTAAIKLYQKCGFTELKCITYYEMH